ncbi:MAG: 50S ribosomal protein L22 [Candidatus Nitrosocaldus sp.]
MPEFDYTFKKQYDKSKHVRASIREVDISHKHAIEICNAIKGMRLEKAKEYLEKVVAKEIPVPFRHYHTKVGHRSELKGKNAFPAGRYPVKAAREILRLLENLEANSEYKGMDLDRVTIIHACAYPGVKIRKFIPRAFGRSSARFNTLTHVELVAAEK